MRSGAYLVAGLMHEVALSNETANARVRQSVKFVQKSREPVGKLTTHETNASFVGTPVTSHQDCER